MSSKMFSILSALPAKSLLSTFCRDSSCSNDCPDKSGTDWQHIQRDCMVRFPDVAAARWPKDSSVESTMLTM
jgi:hypothetical protein